MGKSRIVVVMAGCLFLSSFSFGMYNPEVGRFMQHDPHGINPAGGEINAFSFENQSADGVNIYRYAGSDPVSQSDAHGLLAYVPFERHSRRVNACRLLRCKGKCGPDITQVFNKTFDEVEEKLTKEFEDRPDIKERVCGVGTGGIYHAWDGWDIMNARWKSIRETTGTETYPSGIFCKNTATLNGRCVNVWELNYYLWGVVNKVCGNSEVFALSVARLWAQLRPDDPDCKLGFACAGYGSKAALELTSMMCDMSPCCSTDNVPQYRVVKLSIHVRGSDEYHQTDR